MSGCLEKVIEKLTAGREGGGGPGATEAAIMRAETKAPSVGVAQQSIQCEEVSAAETWRPSPAAEDEEDLLGANMYPSSCDRAATAVKGEFLFSAGGRVKPCPLGHAPAQRKGELLPHEDENLSEGEMYEATEYTECRAVRIKEEPHDEGDFPDLYFPADHSDPPPFCPRITESLKREGPLPPGPIVLPVQKLFSCPDCGKCFTRRTHFLTHQRVHTGEKPFTCPECGKCFTQRSYYVSHQRVHSGERPFCCFKCGKSFRIKSSLNKHLRTHELENPFTCTLCQKTFMHQGHFLAHQRIHMEEKKFSCPLCGKSFIHHGHFVAHQRSHTKETRFSCPYCDKSFIHHGHFVAHLRIHTGEKPFSCSDCGSSFSTHHNLVVHQRLHATSSFTFF